MKKLISILAIFSMLFCCSAMSCSFAAEPAAKKTATTQVSKLKKAGAAAAAATAAVVTACVAWGYSNKEVPAEPEQPEQPEQPVVPESFWSKVGNFASDNSGAIVEVTKDIIYAVGIFCAWYFGRPGQQGEPGQNGQNGRDGRDGRDAEIPDDVFTEETIMPWLQKNKAAVNAILQG